MTVTVQLQNIRKDLESMNDQILQIFLKDSGMNEKDIAQMHRAEMIDHLMAFEEHAAFH